MCTWWNESEIKTNCHCQDTGFNSLLLRIRNGSHARSKTLDVPLSLLQICISHVILNSMWLPTSCSKDILFLIFPQEKKTQIKISYRTKIDCSLNFFFQLSASENVVFVETRDWRNCFHMGPGGARCRRQRPGIFPTVSYIAYIFTP